MSNHNPLPSRERLKELFDYDMGTGEFYWKRTGSGMVAGQLAGTISAKGYKAMRVDGTTYQAHRLSWMRCHGQDPGDLQCDHIDGDKLNNHISNLRLVSNSGNHRNMAVRGDNTSGVTGVKWFKRDSKWHASIRVSGKDIHLGYFTDKDEAIAARQAANERYGFHPNHGRAAA